MESAGISKVAQRSGLTREQIVYIERRGYLGLVTRERGFRRFSEAQVVKLLRIASCRALGLRLDEATAIAGTGAPLTAAELTRLYGIVATKVSLIRREVEAWEYVFGLLQAARTAEGGEVAA
jgi:DNA-binding transcriptional MerR regulator